MKVTVKLFTTLRKGRFEVRDIEYPEGTTAGDIMKGLKFHKDEKIIIFINNVHAKESTLLREGAVIAFFPPGGGG